MAGIFKWVFEGLSQSYGKILARRVRNYGQLLLKGCEQIINNHVLIVGLNYDDLLIEAGDFQTGLARVSAPLRIMRFVRRFNHVYT